MSINSRNGGMQKVFEYFPEMPNEIKLMMVKEMEVCDRFRFSRCSKLSRDFWEKITRNQPCSINFFIGAWKITYEIKHGEYEEGFRLMFDKNDGIKYTELPSLTELWNEKIDQSIDIIKLGFHYVEEGLEFYQNGIKELNILGYCTAGMLINLEKCIGSFKNLEILRVFNDADILNLVLSKIRNPLKKLDVSCMINRTKHNNYDQVFQVQDELRWLQIAFDYLEFLRLSAKHVYIIIGRLTEEDIFNFIKSWENGTYEGRIEKCEWDLKGSRFDNHLLCQLFDIDYTEFSENGINIVQEGSGKVAKLSESFSALQFAIINN